MLQKIRLWPNNLKAVIFTLIAVTVLASTYLIVHAVANNVHYEAESGTKTGNISALTDSTASGGSALAYTNGSTPVCSGAKHTPGGDDGMGGCWPGANNTGVQAGVTLTAYTGPLEISTANTVIENKSINGCLFIQAAGVVIRNSKITCTTGFYAIDATASRSPWLLLENIDIDCVNHNYTAVGEEGVTARRVKIYNCENGFDVNKDMLIEDSYMFNLFNGNEAHADGIQMPSSPTGLNLTVRHNSIIAKDSSGGDGTSAIISSKQADASWPVTGFVIEKNLLSDGAYTLYCPDDASKRPGLTITNNVFVAGSPAFGYATNCDGTHWSGNTLSNGSTLNP